MPKIKTRRHKAASRGPSGQAPPMEGAKGPSVRVVVDNKQRSLGFLPLLIMTIIYVICTAFSDAIGPITSAPGMFRLTEELPRRGCVMPRASP